MPNASLRIPKPSRHATGQTVVRLNGRDFYVGRWRSPQAKAAYERLIAEWLAHGRTLNGDAGLTVVELSLAYWSHVQDYYRKAGRFTSEVDTIRQALRPLKALYAHTPAAEFGPVA